MVFLSDLAMAAYVHRVMEHGLTMHLLKRLNLFPSRCDMSKSRERVEFAEDISLRHQELALAL